jgi:hypothetical protein
MVGRSSGTLRIRVQILVLTSFPAFISRYSGVMRQEVGDVPVDDETSMVTPRISRSAGAHRVVFAYLYS